MTASNRPDMTIEEIVERYRSALAAQADQVRAIRRWARDLNPEAAEADLLASVRHLGALSLRAGKAASSVSGWAGQLGPSLNGAFVRGDLTEDECWALYPEWEPGPIVRRHAAARTPSIGECMCMHTCAEDPATACSLSGEFHTHPSEPCPIHPDAPVTP